MSSSLETILVNVSLKYICLLIYQPILPYEIRGLEATWKVTFPWILGVHSRGIYFIKNIPPPLLKISFPQKLFNLIHWNKGNKGIFVFKGRKTCQSIFISRTIKILKLILKKILFRTFTFGVFPSYCQIHSHSLHILFSHYSSWKNLAWFENCTGMDTFKINTFFYFKPNLDIWFECFYVYLIFGGINWIDFTKFKVLQPQQRPLLDL